MTSLEELVALGVLGILGILEKVGMVDFLRAGLAGVDLLEYRNPKLGVGGRGAEGGGEATTVTGLVGEGGKAASRSRTISSSSSSSSDEPSSNHCRPTPPPNESSPCLSSERAEEADDSESDRSDLMSAGGRREDLLSLPVAGMGTVALRPSPTKVSPWMTRRMSSTSARSSAHSSRSWPFSFLRTSTASLDSSSMDDISSFSAVCWAFMADRILLDRCRWGRSGRSLASHDDLLDEKDERDEPSEYESKREDVEDASDEPEAHDEVECLRDDVGGGPCSSTEGRGGAPAIEETVEALLDAEGGQGVEQ